MPKYELFLAVFLTNVQLPELSRVMPFSPLFVAVFPTNVQLLEFSMLPKVVKRHEKKLIRRQMNLSARLKRNMKGPWKKVKKVTQVQFND